jgi:hypothetical protein
VEALLPVSSSITCSLFNSLQAHSTLVPLDM